MSLGRSITNNGIQWDTSPLLGGFPYQYKLTQQFLSRGSKFCLIKYPCWWSDDVPNSIMPWPLTSALNGIYCPVRSFDLCHTRNYIIHKFSRHIIAWGQNHKCCMFHTFLVGVHWLACKHSTSYMSFVTTIVQLPVVERCIRVIYSLYIPLWPKVFVGKKFCYGYTICSYSYNFLSLTLFTTCSYY